MTTLNEAPLELCHPTDFSNLNDMLDFDLARIAARVRNCQLRRVKPSDYEISDLQKAKERIEQILQQISEVEND